MASQQQKSSPIWGGMGGGAGGRSPDERSPISQGMEGAKRMDPRMKYSHLKIKPKGSSSPNQGSSKRPLPNDPSTSNAASPKPFKIPKLLANTSALDKPIDPRDLFKGAGGAPETCYEDVSVSFGMFKSNFFSHSSSSPSQTNSTQEDSEQPFGEITLKDHHPTAGSGRRDARSSLSPARKEGRDKTTAQSSGSSATKPVDESEEVIPSSDVFSSKPKVPAYFAQLDLGLGSDLKIDSAFGSLAGKEEEEGGGDSSSKEKEESQARKLPSMFGLGF